MPRTDAGLDPLLLEVLACPAEHHAPLRLDEVVDAPGAEGSGTEGSGTEGFGTGGSGTEARPVLVCTECGRSFPIRDGIPVLLLDDAGPGPASP